MSNLETNPTNNAMGGYGAARSTSAQRAFARQQQRSASIIHLSLLLIYTLSLAFRYPLASELLIIQVLGCAICEFLPKILKKYGGTEICLLMTHGCALFSAYLEGIPLIGLILCFVMSWALIPSRPLLLPIAAALALLDIILFQYKDIQNIFTPTYFIDALHIIFICIAGTAFHWFYSMRSAIAITWVSSARYRLPYKTTAISTSLCLIFYALFQFSSSTTPQKINIDTALPTHIRQALSIGSVQNELHIGAKRWIEQSATLQARMIFPKELLPTDSDRQYLRLLQCPILWLDENGVHWGRSKPNKGQQRTESNARSLARFHGFLRLPDDAIRLPPEPLQFVTITRLRGSNQIIPYPDGSDFIKFSPLYRDIHNSVFSPTINLSVTSYKCAPPQNVFSGKSLTLQDAEDLTSIPDSLAPEIRRRIPQIERWRLLSPDMAANEIRQFLQERCRYSVQDLPMDINYPGESLMRFMTGSDDERQGHCQFFATASSMLMRLSGHPSRCVIGYASDEWFENAVIFRSKHAHAWTEYLLGDSWVRHDPTPGQFLQRGNNTELDAIPANEDAFTESEKSKSLLSFIQILALLLGSILGLLIMRRFLKPDYAEAKSGARHQLDKYSEQLLDIALDFGVDINPGSSMRAIITDLEQRSGINCQKALRYYEQQRYATNKQNHREQTNTHWPLKELRQRLYENKETTESVN